MKAVVIALVLLAIIPIGGSAGATDARGKPLDQEEPCDFYDTLVPDGVTAQLVDGGQIVNLDVLVLLDGVAPSDARAVVAGVGEIYKPLNIEVVARFRKVDFPPEPVKNSAGNNWIDSEDLIALSKKAVGGERPDGIDVVYTMTSKDLDGFTAGRADCIEGIKWPTTAFAVGKYYPLDDAYPFGPITVGGGYAVTVAAHEIGHLLAAEHHEATCPDGSDLEPTEDVAGVCTMMFPDIFFIGSRFGVVESAVIRRTALHFAAP